MPEILKVITADSPEPKEIDDAIFVRKLPVKNELYEAGVCIADTSELYEDPQIRTMALERQAAQYWDLPNGERGYEPMLPLESIRELELTAGGLHRAMIMTFKVGAKTMLTDFRVCFGQVEVEANMDYVEFADYVTQGKNNQYGQVAHLIQKQLGYTAYGDHPGHKPAGRPEEAASSDTEALAKAWKRGSKINEAFMVAANHLIGRTGGLGRQARLYRVHDPKNSKMAHLMDASVAYFSTEQGFHSGLKLDSYSRTTSPLRRDDDFFNVWMEKKRYLGLPATEADLLAAREHEAVLNEGLVKARSQVAVA